MDAAPVPIETLLAHREWVRGVARAVARDPSAADDVEQETWLAALSMPPRRASSLRGWLGAVARSRARRIGRGESRREAREAAASRAEATASAAELAEIADAHRRVVQAVVELPEPWRQTILLRYFEGLAVEAVAARTAVPLDTARSRIGRGLALLRERLAREFDTDARRLGAALLPLWAGTKGPAAPAAATGGAVMATKTAWILASTLVLGGVAALALTKWTAAAGEPAVVAAAPAPVPAPPPAPAPQDDPRKPPAPKPDEPKPQPPAPEPAAKTETALEKLTRTTLSGSWQDVPVVEVLGEIAEKADVDVFLTAEAAALLSDRGAANVQAMEFENVGASSFLRLLTTMKGLSHVVEETRVVVHAGGRRDETKPLVPVERVKPGAKRTVTVKGVVLDEQGAPVAGASITSSASERGELARSAADGTFSFELGRPFGAVYAFVSGRVPSWARPVEGPYGAVVEAKLALRGPSATVEGVVRDAQGREAAEAVVRFVAMTPAPDAPPEGVCPVPTPILAAGADGRFRAEMLPPGGWEVVARPKAGGREARVKTSAKPGETVHVELALPATTTWRGRLFDRGGAPIAKAMIQVVGQGVLGRTDADGAFALAGLTPGPAQVQIRRADGAVATRPATIGADAEFRLDLTVGDGPRVAGRVTDASGAPVAGASVRLLPPAPWMPGPTTPRTTGADGAFAFDDLDAGAYRVVVVLGGSSLPAVVRETAAGASDVEIRLGSEAPAKLRVRVVNADGSPEPKACLYVREVGTGESVGARADADGAAAVEGVPRGRYLLDVSAPAGGREIGVRDVGAGGDVDLGVVRLEAPRPVALRWNATGDVAQATTQFVVLRVPSEGAPWARVASETFRGEPDPATHDLAPGRYVVRVAGDLVQSLERTFDVPATGDVSLVLPLRAAAQRRIAPRFETYEPKAARLRVLDADGVVFEYRWRGGQIPARLVPGNYRVEADVTPTQTLRGAFEVPAEGASEKLDVVLR